MEFLGVGAAEALLVFVLILILVGPQRFPEIMRQGGRWYRIARGYTSEVMKDVRAAVDEIEQEVNEESGDLQSIRDLTNVGREIEEDFAATKRDVDAAGADTAAAARSGTETTRNTPRPISSARSAASPARPSTRPSTRTTPATSRTTPPTRLSTTPPAASDAADDEVAELVDEGAMPSEAPATPPADPPRPSAPAGPRISLPEDDPFMALEARRAAAQRSDDDEAEPDDSEKANG